MAANNGKRFEQNTCDLDPSERALWCILEEIE